MSKISDIKARLGCVSTRDEQPCPASPMDEKEVADMLLFLVTEVERLRSRVKILEDRPIPSIGGRCL